MNSVRIFFAGDFCSKPSTSLITVSDELRDLIRSCDIRIVNFEVPLKPDKDLSDIGYERFYQNDDAPDFLKSVGFNLFPMANNHMFDWGDDGFLKTKHVFGDMSFGSGNYEEAYRTKIVEVNGVKIGFMALTYAAFFGVFDDALSHDGLGCAYINDLRVNHDIIEAKTNVDFLIVLPHDGIEYIDVPLPETIARYRDFIDYGADAVMGTHPHCPQGWEMYKGSPIFYSLGNFFFNSKEDPSYRAWNRPHWYEGLCLVVTIDSSGLSFQTINTRNVDNLCLELDHRKERIDHNEMVCLYLQDNLLYEKYLTGCLAKLAKEQELPIIDGTIHSANIKLVVKKLLSKAKQILTKNDMDNDRSIKMLMKNDSRRNALIRYLNNNK